MSHLSESFDVPAGRTSASAVKGKELIVQRNSIQKDWYVERSGHKFFYDIVRHFYTLCSTVLYPFKFPGILKFRNKG